MIYAYSIACFSIALYNAFIQPFFYYIYKLLTEQETILEIGEVIFVNPTAKGAGGALEQIDKIVYNNKL